MRSAATILMLDGDELVHRAGTGFIADSVGATARASETPSPAGSTAEGSSAICNDTAELANPLARKRGIGSMIAVPLRHGDTVVGLVSVLSRRPGAFTQEDLGTLELLSVVLSAAVSHAGGARGEACPGRCAGAFPHGFRRSLDRDHQGRSKRTHAGGEPRARADARLHGCGAGSDAVQEITHPDDIEHNLGLFRDLIEGKRDSYQLEKRYVRRDGELIWGRITAVLERDEEGRPGSVFSMIEDITERKIAEQELRRQSELNQYQALHDALTGLPNRTLLPRPHRAGDPRRAARRRARRGAADGPRPLQGGQRHARPPRRRRAAQGGRQRGSRRAACVGHRRAARRRRVRPAAAGARPSRPTCSRALEQIRADARAADRAAGPAARGRGVDRRRASTPTTARTWTRLLQRADVAMYAAKERQQPLRASTTRRRTATTRRA